VLQERPASQNSAGALSSEPVMMTSLSQCPMCRRHGAGGAVQSKAEHTTAESAAQKYHLLTSRLRKGIDVNTYL